MASNLDRRPPSRGITAALTTLVCGLLGLLGIACAHDGVHAPPNAPKATPSKTVVLVHGMFMDPSCWTKWKPYLESHGYTVIAPAWPAHEGSAAEARAAFPDPKLAAVGLDDVLKRYREVIAELDEKPILIGHSMGGLVIEILLSEGLGSAGVAIDAAPPKGVFALNHAFLKSNGRILRGSLEDPLDMDLARFSYVFVNAEAPDEQRVVWEAHARPESRRVGRDSTKAAGKIDFGRRRPPLLLIAGERDHAVPAVIVRKVWRRYGRADAITELHEFAGVDHWLIGSDHWQEVADYALAWLARQGT